MPDNVNLLVTLPRAMMDHASKIALERGLSLNDAVLGLIQTGIRNMARMESAEAALTDLHNRISILEATKPKAKEG